MVLVKLSSVHLSFTLVTLPNVSTLMVMIETGISLVGLRTEGPKKPDLAAGLSCLLLHIEDIGLGLEDRQIQSSENALPSNTPVPPTFSISTPTWAQCLENSR